METSEVELNASHITKWLQAHGGQGVGNGGFNEDSLPVIMRFPGKE